MTLCGPSTPTNALLFTFISTVIISETSGSRVCYPRRNAVGVAFGEICYSDDAPFDDLPLPQDADEIEPTFYYVFLLKDHTTKVAASPLQFADVSLVLNSNSSILNDLVIIVHGWTGNWHNTAKWRDPLVKNLLQIKPTTQVIYVEWSVGAALHLGQHPYAHPAANTRLVGDRLADFFLQSTLVNRPGFNLSNVHCIGFSLGAHVCGFASKRMWAERKLRWGRVTALDPARIYFDKGNPTARLSHHDADFVDVIHSSRMGLDRRIGHIDFYPNPPSKAQPGCYWPPSKRRRRRDVLSHIFSKIEDFAVDFISCSHLRSALLFAETIVHPPVLSHCSFEFCPCDSLADWQADRCDRYCPNSLRATMGYWSVRDWPHKRGLFFGETTAARPYCKTNN